MMYSCPRCDKREVESSMDICSHCKAEVRGATVFEAKITHELLEEMFSGEWITNLNEEKPKSYVQQLEEKVSQLESQVTLLKLENASLRSEITVIQCVNRDLQRG